VRADCRQSRPSVEGLESRLAPAVAANPNAAATLAVLEGFTKAYPSHVGNPQYNPVYDVNHNGLIGQDDGKILLHTLPPVSPPIPLRLTVAVAPQDQAHGRLPHNSGGFTPNRTPTIVGHTTPGALIFTGTGTVDLRLHGPAYVADANGNFSFKITNHDGINQLDLLVVDAYGHQYLRAFPIYWTGFAAYENAHPAKT
jgi:hypothetical protein